MFPSLLGYLGINAPAVPSPGRPDAEIYLELVSDCQPKEDREHMTSIICKVSAHDIERNLAPLY
jgi:hypothetical protein